MRKLTLRNIRCFEDVEISFVPQGAERPSMWNLVLGDNGTGKSTLLKAIALAIASPKERMALFEQDSGRSEWLRPGAPQGHIEVEVSREDSIVNLRVDVHRAEYGETILGPPGGTATHGLLVCGYGPERRSVGTRESSAQQRYLSREAVATLFNPEMSLQNPELTLWRVASSFPGGADSLLRMLDQLLMLPLGSTLLGPDGLLVNGPWGVSLPIAALSDGYRSTLAWLLDMAGWAIQQGVTSSSQTMSGIVLLDEIEQHLHPAWQRRIVALLHEQFPYIQFIATTHAPLCVIGTTDLHDADVTLIHLQRDEQSVHARSRIPPPRGRRADQLLTSYLFGLDTTSDSETRRAIGRLSRLLSKMNRTAEEEQEVNRLRESLSEALGETETVLEQHVSSAIAAALDRTVQEQLVNVAFSKDPSAAPLHREVVLLEARRRLQEMAEGDRRELGEQTMETAGGLP